MTEKSQNRADPHATYIQLASNLNQAEPEMRDGKNRAAKHSEVLRSNKNQLDRRTQDGKIPMISNTESSSCP